MRRTRHGRIRGARAPERTRGRRRTGTRTALSGPDPSRGDTTAGRTVEAGAARHRLTSERWVAPVVRAELGPRRCCRRARIRGRLPLLTDTDLASLAGGRHALEPRLRQLRDHTADSNRE